MYVLSYLKHPSLRLNFLEQRLIKYFNHFFKRLRKKQTQRKFIERKWRKNIKNKITILILKFLIYIENNEFYH